MTNQMFWIVMIIMLLILLLSIILNIAALYYNNLKDITDSIRYETISTILLIIDVILICIIMVYAGYNKGLFVNPIDSCDTGGEWDISKTSSYNLVK